MDLAEALLHRYTTSVVAILNAVRLYTANPPIPTPPPNPASAPLPIDAPPTRPQLIPPRNY